MDSDDLLKQMQTAIDNELHSKIEVILKNYPAEYVSMLNYQLGWEGENGGKEAQGKRIRPLLVLLSCYATGGDWQDALPAAAAVEMVHNFSLIHDDIQDRSRTRRGRPTVWVRWGEAQAINAGDAMLMVAYLSLQGMLSKYSPLLVNQALLLLQTASLQLTRGQHLDIAFENQDDLSLELYWEMVEGKTSSLLATCLALGALLGRTSEECSKKMLKCGYQMGAAFQVQDDWLGIWGDDAVTGKSTTSDLIAKKKTYPILLGIQATDKFQENWQVLTKVSNEDAKKLAELLVEEGIKDKTQQQFELLYKEAFTTLDELPFEPNRIEPLRKVLDGVFGRIK